MDEQGGTRGAGIILLVVGLGLAWMGLDLLGVPLTRTLAGVFAPKREEVTDAGT
jgi:hypothetical protein